MIAWFRSSDDNSEQRHRDERRQRHERSLAFEQLEELRLLSADVGHALFAVAADSGDHSPPAVMDSIVADQAQTSVQQHEHAVAAVAGANQNSWILPIVDQEVTVGEQLSIVAGPVESNSTEVLTYGLTGDAPDGARVDSLTGEVTWTPVESQADRDYLMGIIATDGIGTSSASTFNVRVVQSVTGSSTLDTPAADDLLSVDSWTDKTAPTNSGSATDNNQNVPSTVSTFNPTDDALVKSAWADRSYGSQVNLRLRDDASGYRSYVKFDVNTIDAQVTRATLRLFVDDASRDGGTVYSVPNIYKGTNTAWTQEELTWNNAPLLPPTYLDSVGEVFEGTWVEFDVTAAVSGNGIHSFGLISTSTNSAMYSSTEGRFPPQLVILSSANPTVVQAQLSGRNVIANDDVKSTSQVVAQSGRIQIIDHNVVFSDPDAINNHISLSFDGADFLLSIAGSSFFSESIPDSLRIVDADTIAIPTGVLGNDGQIIINGRGGDDTLTVDFAGGAAVPVGGVTFNGGDHVTLTGDTLLVENLENPGLVTINHTGLESDGFTGSVQVGEANDGRTITFTGIEPLVSSGDVNNIVFNLPDVGNTDATLTDIGGGQFRLAGTTFETTNFDAPPVGGSLTINLGDGDDTLSIDSLTLNQNATLNVNGQLGTDSVQLFGDSALPATTNLNVESTLRPTFLISEILSNSPESDARDKEYIEFVSSHANATIPLGTYFATIRGEANDGEIRQLFDLGGLTFGDNGYLVIRHNTIDVHDQSAAIYTAGNDGFSGVANFQTSSGSNRLDKESATWMLFTAANSPSAGDDIDTNDDGHPDGVFVTDSWNVLDSVSILDNDDNSVGYGKIVFSVSSGGNSPLAETIVQTPNSGNKGVDYVSRAGSGTGYSASDWVGAEVSESRKQPYEIDYAFSSGFDGLSLDHVGSANFGTSPYLTAPDFTSPLTFNVAENTTAVGTVSVDDSAAVLTPGDGADQSLFTLTDHNDGTASLTFTTAPDFETPGESGNAYVVEIVATDASGNVSTQTITVNVTDVIEDGPPSVSTFNATDDALVKSAWADRSYGGQDHIRLRDGASGYRSYVKFDVNGIDAPVTRATLRLYVVDPSGDGGTVYSVPNSYKDTNTAWTQDELTWNNAPLLPASHLDSVGAVSEGTWVEFDVTAAVSGNGTHSFGLSSASGNSVMYSSTEGNFPPQLVIEADDLPSPAFSSSAMFIIPENTTSVGTVIVDDPNATLVLDGGANRDLFTLTDNNDGTATLVFTTAPDFENPAAGSMNNDHVVHVVATNSEGRFRTQAVTVSVTDVDDTAPQFLSPASFAVVDHTTAVGTVNVDDSAAVLTPGDGADQSLFTLTDHNDGTASLTFTSAPDFGNPGDDDLDNVYQVEVISTDQLGNVATQMILVTVLEPDLTAPDFTSPLTFNVAENTTAVGTVSVDDSAAVLTPGDGADQSLFTLTDHNDGTASLTFTTAPDFETPGESGNAYVVEIVATDASGNVSTQTITVNVTDVIEDGPPSVSTFNATDDALVKSAWADRSYGGQDHIRLRDGASGYRSYVKFDVNGIDAPVTRATLRLYVVDPSGDGGTVYSVPNSYKDTNTAWTQDELTWNNAPLLPASHLDSVGAVSEGTWVEFDVTAAVSGNGTHSFGLSSASGNSVMYSSTEGDFPPQLVIEADGGNG